MPNDVATLFATLVTHEQVKGIRGYDIAIYLKFCAAHRDVMDCAIDFRSLERDRSGLQDLMTLVLSVVHEGDSLGVDASRQIHASREEMGSNFAPC